MLSALSVDNGSALPWTTTRWSDDKHSQPNAELAKGRQVRMPCAPVDSTPAPQRLALLNKKSRHGSTMCIHTTSHTNLLLPDLTPHFLSIASSGSPECCMRCAIAHFRAVLLLKPQTVAWPVRACLHTPALSGSRARSSPPLTGLDQAISDFNPRTA